MYLWDIENKSTYNNRMGRYKTQSEFEFISKYIKSSQMILDIGGGSGRLAIPFNQDGNKITVVDRDAEALSILRQRCPKITTVATDFIEWDYEEKRSFDIILSIEVLLYIKDWETYFNKVRNLLKDDGVFIFTATNKNSWRTILQRWREGQKANYNYSVFSLNSYQIIIEKSSFKIDNGYGFLWIPCPINSNSMLVVFFSKLEKILHLNQFLKQSPWLIFALKKNHIPASN